MRASFGRGPRGDHDSAHPASSLGHHRPHCRDDPTILAWSLANEPRCAGDAGCTTIPCWAGATAAYLKGLDPNHLIALVRVCVGVGGWWQLGSWAQRQQGAPCDARMLTCHVLPPDPNPSPQPTSPPPPRHPPAHPLQDSEGFLGPCTPVEATACNPYNCAGSGCDFAGARTAQSPSEEAP